MVSVRSLYEDSCIKFKCRQNAELLRRFPSTEGRFDILTEVDLHDNLVGRKGIRPVMEVVKACSNCERVSVADNFLTNDSVKEIVGALMEHPGVRFLDLSRNPISHPAGKMLCDFASKSKTISEIILNDTLINPALVKIIQSKANENFMNADESVRRRYENSRNMQLSEEGNVISEDGIELEEQPAINSDADNPAPEKNEIDPLLGKRVIQFMVDNLHEFKPPKTKYPPWWGIRTLHSLVNGAPYPEFEPSDEVLTKPEATSQQDDSIKNTDATPKDSSLPENESKRDVPPLQDLDPDEGTGLDMALSASETLYSPKTDKSPWWYLESLERILRNKPPLLSHRSSLPSALVEKKSEKLSKEVTEESVVPTTRYSSDALSRKSANSIVRRSLPLGLIAMAANEEEGESLLKTIAGMVECDLGSNGLGAAFAAMDIENNTYSSMELVREIYECGNYTKSNSNIGYTSSGF
eukprot:TRINITY_DN300_c2_g1_i2.p1 TRINITY_DN300_c2_g1~~TRINITY_DN300_c2_g1_i2.p1  ORF type:complete len:468 (+),score=78.88 TRINITY_DN300_c2_g1_i2:65-1468(+)